MDGPRSWFAQSFSVHLHQTAFSMSDWAGGPFLVIEDLWFTDLLEQNNSHCKPFIVGEDFLGNEPLSELV